IGWWATSALESNVGLNAIAQWVFSLKPHLVQGLGTGQVFSNNINSPLELKGSYLYYNPAIPWQSPAGNV
ncbi:MAG: o-succinylbenzoate synthase, partial [Bacteroidota bacterium]